TCVMLRWLVLGSFCAGVVACSSEPPAFGSGNGDSPDIGSDASVGGDGTNGAASGAPIGVTPAASAEEGGPNQANSAATNDVEENSGDESNGLNMTNANTDGSETDGPTTTAPDMMTSSSV